MSDLFYKNPHNSDVLSCLANLSNDEVFTPPKIAKDMLDMLPQELFSDKNTTFLDPACKSGVFLREIAKRLLTGLESQIPDLQERIDHIFHKQLFGIAITELTSLLSRRSVYCSKYPNSNCSITKFDNAEGNIRFRKIRHTWDGNKCRFCRASKAEYDRDDMLESHAYEFIHTDTPEEIFKMKFDVIIGNPPYQLSTAGDDNGAQAKPIYHLFVEQAVKLTPRYVSMITPARWFNGGFGLDKFRGKMLNDNRIRVIHDYLDAGDCFPGVQIKGGVCFFLWDRNSAGLCKVYTHREGHTTESERPLLEPGLSTFIRWGEAISIIHKVTKKAEQSFSSLVSPRDPFGLNYYENGREIMFKKFKDEPFQNSATIYSQGWMKNGIRLCLKI